MSEALCRKIDELTTTIDEQADMVAALTEQRDALLAACEAIQDVPRWHRASQLAQDAGYEETASAMTKAYNLAAAAIAQGEAKE